MRDISAKIHVDPVGQIDQSRRLSDGHDTEKIAPKRNYFVCVITIFFGIGSWLGVNSTFLQVPLMIDKAPEGWTLPSYIETINQFGNFGPLIYTLSYKLRSQRIKDEYLIYGFLSMGALAAILMAFFYGINVDIGGKSHSIALFILFYCFALTGCTSSVLFMPFMGRFRELYLITYFIGEGLSGFLSSIVGIIQGVGGSTICIPSNTTDGKPFVPYTPPPRFPPRDFFIFVFVLMACSLTAFILLNKLKICKDQYDILKMKNRNLESESVAENNSRSIFARTECRLSPKLKRSVLALMMAIAFFETGILASVQSYSCLPYGNQAYHLTVSLTLIMNLIAAFCALFLPHISVRTIFITSACNSILGFYILSTALLSPNPPLAGTLAGEISIILIWAIFMGIFNYIKVTISTLMRAQGGNSLIWTGALAQTGSSSGSIMTFCIVNFTKVFVAKDQCA